MNWFLLFVAFALAVFMGAASSALFTMLKPHWSGRRRLLVSASLLPGIAIVTTGALVLGVVVGGTADPTMQDLVAAAIARLGAMVALLALVGGLVGAALQQLGARR